MGATSSAAARSRAVAMEMRDLGLDDGISVCWVAIALVAIVNAASAIVTLLSL